MRKIIIAFIALLLPFAAMADSYNNLWKLVKDAQQKDLPKTQIKYLDEICAKATADKQYGQLLKASLLKASAQTAISPDSADVEIARLEKRQAVAQDRVLKAVYASVLGHLYAEKSLTAGAEAAQKSREMYAASLADMPLLAKTESEDYSPALVSGEDSRIFYGDLLHVLGMEAKAYGKLRDYYATHNNRPAACIFAAKALAAEKPEVVAKARKSRYVQRIDSLITVYGDLREAGELAVMHYNAISDADDITAEDKVNYINYALSRWGAWPRMNILRNALSDLQQPSFAINIGDAMMLPGVERTLRINGIRNVNELTINVYRVKAAGNADIDPTTAKGYAKMKDLVVPGAVFTATRRYIGQPAWKENTDTINIKCLPVGVYLIEATTGTPGIEVQRELLYVSNLYIIHESLPDNRVRFAVVNATTGRPISGAHLVVGSSSYSKEGTVTKNLVTDHDGEVILSYAKGERPNRVYAYTDDDKACRNFSFYTSYHYWSDNRTVTSRLQTFTDRNLYRPGQTVHVTAIAWDADRSTLSSKTVGDKTVKFELFDANGKSVSTKTASTDRYGTASADFVLPQGGLTGSFNITASCADRSSGSSFHVEQYKRPAFQVSFDKYKDAYKDGDTISVRGLATTYSGVPVQGAKVVYTVNRRQGLWWFRSGPQTEVASASTTTASDGSFVVRVPMDMPEDVKRVGRLFYDFDVNAIVTDGAGESHEATTTLPLSNRAVVLSSDVPAKVLRDSLKTISFSCKNLAGEEVAATVSYRLDGGEWKTTPTQTPTAVAAKLTSGLHTLEAVCQGDTLKQEVVVFSLSDKRPAVPTHDWFYLSADRFSADGKPIYLQLGTSDEDTHIYYTAFAGNKVIEQGSKTLSNEVVTRKLQYKESFGDGLTLTMAWVAHGKLYTHTVELQRPQPDTSLKLSWKTFRDKLRPGQKETWTLTIASPKGKAARAQLLATLFDKSLDAVYSQHSWQVNNNFYFSLPRAAWDGGSHAAIGLYGFQPYTAFKERALDFTHFDSDLFGWASPVRHDIVFIRGTRVYKQAQVEALAAVNSLASVDEVATLGAREASDDEEIIIGYSNKAAKAGDTGMGKSGVGAQLRENFNETAFYYPALTTDAQGNVNISFTLPESVTTWRFLGLAHDTLMNNSVITAEAVASKPVMVQPNMPRFLRQGDNATLSAILSNTTDHRQSGTVRLVFVDAETERVLMEKRQTFALSPKSSLTATFKVDAAQLAERAAGQSLLVARIYAEGNGYSDGEQHYLPLLPDKERVVNTLPFYLNEAGVKNLDLTKLFPNGSTDRKLTEEYTNNPAWLVIQALPTLASPSQTDAASLAAAIYANVLGRQLLTASPKIAQTIKLWQQEQDATSLTSNLSKNEELKTMVLSETPWVAEAEHETDQKQMLAQYLDASTIDYRISNFTAKLAQLQNGDGSFSWWPGMKGSVYQTMNVIETLTRLNKLAGRQAAFQSMLANAFSYMKGEISKEVAELKKDEKKGVKGLQPSETACHYLYSAALDGQKATADRTYLIDLLDRQSSQLTIYGKACTAVILAQYGKTAHAKTLLESLRQYTVYREETGRYFDTHKAQYSWMDYRIPTQTAAIEALQMLEPNDTATVQQLQRWLLHEKRTTSWSTSINSVNAVYAFLSGARADVLDNGDMATLRLNGQPLALPKSTAGIGYVKVVKDATDARNLSIDKTSAGTSWGAVYGSFMQKTTEVASATAGLKVTRVIDDGMAGSLKVGQKVKVRITIVADRDYDFVQVQDKRAACLEPVSQVSGYRWSNGGGYYLAPQDNVTNYYFDKLSKGTHVVETEYFVDRAGDYATGLCTVVCAYAPEFSGREAALKVPVK